ncbi:alternative oxidase [Candidatus Pelagibacter sp.]|nr:alternative oxidase [Candidatus Pelagibacter sp.]
MINLDIHHKPENLSDRIALGFTKLLRFIADTFFKKKYGHRAVVLETVAAVPGMVGGMLIHLKSIRRIKEDKGWIKTLLDEAENERMHLMTFINIAQPTMFERFLIMFAFNLLILINTGLNFSIKKIILYMVLGSIFILVLYLGFKNLLLVPLPEGLWFRDI